MLTAFKSSTPSFASCSKVTNLVVSSPRLFSCLLGVCGCSESPTAPSSPLLLADSSSIITRDQLRTSPCLPDQTQPASLGKHALSPQWRQTESRGSEWRIAGVKWASPSWFAPNYFTKSSRAGWVRLFNERRAVGGESRWPREVWRDGSIARGTVYKYPHRFKSVSQRLFKLVRTINTVTAATVLRRGHTFITCEDYVLSFFVRFVKQGVSRMYSGPLLSHSPLPTQTWRKHTHALMNVHAYVHNTRTRGHTRSWAFSRPIQ